ncbi:MAG: xanthine dehydrogenase molybdopterin binding subunit [Bacteriovorax sp. MedPE-SWde]|nr:MAG: xanthine dehydrogenase molybdopterin binding subunit [Bacteriovorax sp. MedPE-SWde]
MSVGKNIKHDSSYGHVTGESIFVDDRPVTHGELFVGVVGSPVACGVLKSIDSSEALRHESCVGVYSAADLSAKKWGAIFHDQPILVEDEIGYMGEPLCIFASTSRDDIEYIKTLFKFDIEEGKPIFSISDAVAKDSLIYAAPSPFAQGNVDEAFKTAKNTLEGKFICGGQEHFYMESQATVAYPMENGQVEVHSSSQHPSETQRVVAEALGLPLHHVVCVVKRMGGGFGGKESQAAPIAAYAALVAQKLNKPARLILTKDEDMIITGKRHPFANDYKVAFDDNGKIEAIKMILRSDAGAYSDLSSSILERGMFHADGAYFLKNVHIEGYAYKTNNHSNTAYRGFGGPQGNMTIESIIEDIACFLKKDSFEIRRHNIYENNNVKTPYGQDVENNMLPQLFDNLYESSDYKNRLEEIKEFNSQKNGKIKGLSLTATKFGIAFTARFLNQGNALVNVQLDGTIQVSTGATEMGQGVNTKIQQICAHAFGIPSDDVQVMTTSTEKNHNTSPTAASSGSDINGAAALSACNKVKGRLTELAKLIFAGEESNDLKEYEIGKGSIDPDIVFKEKVVKQVSTGKEIALKDLVFKAYFNRISVGGYAFFKTPGLGFCKSKVEGKAFNYFTQGVAATEVLIDEYTGEMKVMRADILMDLGRPINPGIDRGQVTGAYVQGMGWVTTENLFYNDKGSLISHSPTTYKIPNVQDTPRIFNVDFISNDDNDCNVHRSKAVGEPPFLLGTSAWTAVKHALSFRSNGELIDITSPATGEVILNELTGLKSGN